MVAGRALRRTKSSTGQLGNQEVPEASQQKQEPAPHDFASPIQTRLRRRSVDGSEPRTPEMECPNPSTAHGGEADGQVDATANSGEKGPSEPKRVKKKKEELRSYDKWTQEEEKLFFASLKAIQGSNAKCCWESIARSILSKDLAQVREYYYRLIKRLNKMLGADRVLDKQNHMEVHVAMDKFWEMCCQVQQNSGQGTCLWSLKGKQRKKREFEAAVAKGVMQVLRKHEKRQAKQTAAALAQSAAADQPAAGGARGGAASSSGRVAEQAAGGKGQRGGAKGSRTGGGSGEENVNPAEGTDNQLNLLAAVAAGSDRPAAKPPKSRAQAAADSNPANPSRRPLTSRQTAAATGQAVAAATGHMGAAQTGSTTAGSASTASTAVAALGASEPVAAGMLIPSAALPARLVLRLLPLTAEVSAALEAVGINPLLELGCKSRKPLSDVINHLTGRWAVAAASFGADAYLRLHLPSEAGVSSETVDGKTTAGALFLSLQQPDPFEVYYSWVSTASLAAEAHAAQQAHRSQPQQASAVQLTTHPAAGVSFQAMQINAEKQCAAATADAALPPLPKAGSPQSMQTSSDSNAASSIPDMATEASNQSLEGVPSMESLFNMCDLSLPSLPSSPDPADRPADDPVAGDAPMEAIPCGLSAAQRGGVVDTTGGVANGAVRAGHSLPALSLSAGVLAALERGAFVQQQQPTGQEAVLDLTAGPVKGSTSAPATAAAAQHSGWMHHSAPSALAIPANAQSSAPADAKASTQPSGNAQKPPKAAQRSSTGAPKRKASSQAAVAECNAASQGTAAAAKRAKVGAAPVALPSVPSSAAPQWYMAPSASEQLPEGCVMGYPVQNLPPPNAAIGSAFQQHARHAAPGAAQASMRPDQAALRQPTAQGYPPLLQPAGAVQQLPQHSAPSTPQQPRAFTVPQPHVLPAWAANMAAGLPPAKPAAQPKAQLKKAPAARKAGAVQRVQKDPKQAKPKATKAGGSTRGRSRLGQAALPAAAVLPAAPLAAPAQEGAGLPSTGPVDLHAAPAQSLPARPAASGPSPLPGKSAAPMPAQQVIAGAAAALPDLPDAPCPMANNCLPVTAPLLAAPAPSAVPLPTALAMTGAATQPRAASNQASINLPALSAAPQPVHQSAQHAQHGAQQQHSTVGLDQPSSFCTPAAPTSRRESGDSLPSFSFCQFGQDLGVKTQAGVSSQWPHGGMPLAPSSSMDAASTGTGGSARSEASFKGWAPALRAEPAAHAATPPGAFSFASQPVGPAPTLQATHSKALEAVPMADDAFLSNTDLDLALDLNFDSLDPSKWEEIKGTPAPADSSQQQLAQGLYGPNPTQFLSSHAQPGAAMAQDQHQLSLTPSLEPWGLNLGSRGSFEEFGVGESTYSAFSEGRAGVPPTSAGPCTGPCNFQMLFQREHDI